MTTYKELADRLGMFKAAEFQEAAAILRSLDAQRPTVDEVMELVDSFGICVYQEGLDDGTGKSANPIYGVEAEAKIRTAIEALAAPVAAQPPNQPVDPVHVINTAIDVMMRRDATIAGVLFDFMGWLTTRKERLCLSSADDASPAVTAITEFAKMRNLSLDNAMVTDWQSVAAQASKPLSDAEIFDLAEPFGAFEFGDAQGDKRLAFAHAAITAFCLKNGIKERG